MIITVVQGLSYPLVFLDSHSIYDVSGLSRTEVTTIEKGEVPWQEIIAGAGQS